MRKGRPIVSTIVALYNGREFIVEAIESIRSQSYVEQEIIVVDDGSTDGGGELVRKYSDICYIKQKNHGAAAARNKGVQESRGKYLAFLDQDDIWTPDKLKVQVDFLEENPVCGFVISHQEVFGEKDASIPEGVRAYVTNQEFDHRPVAFLPGTLMVRKDTFLEIGFFDERLKNNHDADWFSRAFDHTTSFHVLPDSLLKKRFHENNASYNENDTRREHLEMVKASIKRKRG